jgi:hypothetical protein
MICGNIIIWGMTGQRRLFGGLKLLSLAPPPSQYQFWPARLECEGRR